MTGALSLIIGTVLEVQLLLFLCVLVVFHLSEFLLVALVEPAHLEWSSLLLSRQYFAAMMLSMAEFWAEALLCSAAKKQVGVAATTLGAALVLAGETMRKTAWLTAGPSFTHKIQTSKRPAHKLITHGIYAYERHPAYLGWFMWAVGTQVLLANPVCVVAFAVASWRFFKVRIPYEEQMLLRLFGLDYALYRSRVRTRVPSVS